MVGGKRPPFGILFALTAVVLWRIAGGDGGGGGGGRRSSNLRQDLRQERLDECQHYLQEVGTAQCSAYSSATLDEVEEALEQRMGRRMATAKPGHDQELTMTALDLDRIRLAKIVKSHVMGKDGETDGDGDDDDCGACRPGDINSTVVCDGREVTDFPSSDIPDSPLDLLVINDTLLESVRAGDLSGKTAASIVIEDNAALTEFGADAFAGASGTVYLRAQRNRLSVQATDWSGDFFAPFRSLTALRFLVLEYNDYDAGVLKDFGDVSAQSPCLPCLEHLSLRGNPLSRIGGNFFSGLRCSPVKELVLHNSEIQTIDKGMTTDRVCGTVRKMECIGTLRGERPLTYLCTVLHRTSTCGRYYEYLI